MKPEIPAIWKAVALVLRDLGCVPRKLPSLTFVALLIVLALELVPFFVPVYGWTRLSVILLFVGWNAAHPFFLTPYLIAVHRFVILGEVTATYRLVPTDKRFQRFFGMSLVLVAMIWTTDILIHQLISSEMTLPSVSSTIAGVVGIVVMAVVAARMITLFPAAAVDAPVITWGRTMVDTKGNTWRILLIFLLAFLPLAVVGIAVTGLAVFVIGSVIGSAMGKDAAATLTLAVVLAVWLAIIQTTAATLAVVIASRLYQWLSEPKFSEPHSAFQLV
jgi:hypothetical protein